MQRKHIPSLLAFIVIVFSMLACNFGKTPAAGGNSPSSSNPSSSSSGGNAGACANPLYPVVANATWTYSFSNATLGNFTRTITSVSADGFTDQDVFTKGITRSGEWKCQSGALINLSPDNGPTASIQKSNAIQADFKTTAMDGVTLPASIQTGDSWKQSFTLEGTETINGLQIPAKNETTNTCTAAGMESVTVPAGTFNAYHLDCTADINITITMNGASVPTKVTAKSTEWYAPGVGLVKTDTLIDNTTPVTIELTAYNIP